MLLQMYKKQPLLMAKHRQETLASPLLRAPLHHSSTVLPTLRIRSPPQSHFPLYLRASRLLLLAREALEANVGIPLASTAAFPPLGSPGVLGVQTDASRANLDDGVGGFAFHPALPKVVFLLSVAWPPDIKEALDFAALPRAQQAFLQAAWPGRPALSMPCAEAFGGWAVALAVAANTRLEVSAVIAVGDCEPAAGAYNKSSSSRPQMNAILLAMRGLTTQWLGVAVRRDFNLDADRLSHPSMLAEVARDVVLAGYDPVVLGVPEEAWRELRRAMCLSNVDVT